MLYYEKSKREKGTEMINWMVLYSVEFIFAIIGLIASFKGLRALWRYIRIWIKLKEAPSYEVFKERYVREAYRNDFDRLDYRDYFWSF